MCSNLHGDPLRYRRAGNPPRRDVRALRARAVAALRSDAPHQYGARRLHRPGRLRRFLARPRDRASRRVRALDRARRPAAGRIRGRLRAPARGAQRDAGEGSAAVARRHLRARDRDREPAPADLYGGSSLHRAGCARHRERSDRLRRLGRSAPRLDPHRSRRPDGGVATLLRSDFAGTGLPRGQRRSGSRRVDGARPPARVRDGHGDRLRARRDSGDAARHEDDVRRR